MRRLLVPVLALLLAGCTTTDPGRPTAGDRPTETSTSSSSPTSTSTKVNRPRNVDLAAVDVCQVLAGLPLADLGLDTDRPPLAGDSSLFPGSKDCFANGLQQNVALLVVAVVNQGAAEYLDGANAEVQQSDVNGFPLYVLTTQASPDTCFGVLDVNDGQMLFINYGHGDTEPGQGVPQATLCQRVPDIARAALARL